MATTFKLYAGATSDGAVYIDMPFAGKITNIRYAVSLSGGAGGIALATVELSRVAVNQVGVNNPRGVIDSVAITTQAASTGICVNVSRPDVDEPIKAGERLYLNTGGSAANVTTLYAQCYVTVA